MRLVLLESPYAGDIAENERYARKCLRNCVLRGDAAIASHLLYTQPGVLADNDPDERALGIAAGLAWRDVAEVSVFYTDRGWSKGMNAALLSAIKEGKGYELRSLHDMIQLPDPEIVPVSEETLRAHFVYERRGTQVIR